MDATLAAATPPPRPASPGEDVIDSAKPPGEAKPDPVGQQPTPRAPGQPPERQPPGPAGQPREPASQPAGFPGQPPELGGLPPDLPGQKAALRRRILAARAGLTEDQRAEAGRLLRDAVLSLPEAQMAGTVAAYYSVAAEPPTRSLVYALWKRGSYVLLPLLRPDGDLDWASYEGPDSVAAARYGLVEPTEPAGAAITSADLVIVPALAADRRGNRLGRGRGCYDRALARVGPLIPTIALLYDGELLDELPAGPLDHRVRMAARPNSGIVRLTHP
jgi:5-formyltetrahydrofolate cyclo-ligase